jgi:hypothetical protein
LPASTVVLAAFVTVIGVGLIGASPQPTLKGVALPFSLVVGVAIAIYAVWLNPRNKRP